VPTLIQQRDVTEPANVASIVWRGSRDPKSHTIIRPELSKTTVKSDEGQANKQLTSAKQPGEISIKFYCIDAVAMPPKGKAGGFELKLSVRQSMTS
jgi:hypothetical protein